MVISLAISKDPREQLQAEALWKRGTPLKLALFGNRLFVPDYVNIECENFTADTPASVVADLSKLQFPALSINEILIQDGIVRYDPAFVAAFISKCAAWLNVLSRITIQVPAGNWTYPATQAGHAWHPDALIALFDHFGFLVDYVGKTKVAGIEKVVISGGRPERRVSLGSRDGLLQRLIEGPLCSMGCVPQELTEEFYARCLGYLNRTPEKISAPNYSLRAPYAASKRLNILHTVEFYAPHVGGAEGVIKSLSEKLAARGHSVTVATSFLPEREFSELNGVDIEQFKIAGSTAMGISGSEVPHYMRFIREFPCDVMMNYAAQQWATDLVLPMLPRFNTRANIITPCGYSAMSSAGQLRFPEFSNYYKYIIPRAFQQADAVVYHSRLYQDFVCGQMMGCTNSEIIPNAVDEKEFNAALSINVRIKYSIRENFVLLSVGNFLAGKGQENLIQMLRDMNRPDVALVLIGRSGPTLEKLRAQAAGLPVYFLVDIPREDTVSAYFHADLFVFASELEASPLVIIESKAAQLPFISTDVGNVKEWQGGVVCAAEKMASEVTKLLENPVERHLLGEAGRKEYEEKLTWTAVLDRYEEMYLRIFRSKKGVSPTLTQMIDMTVTGRSATGRSQSPFDTLDQTIKNTN